GCADRVARLARADAELAELIHRQSRRRALEHARQLRCDRDGAKRRRVLVAPRLQVAIQPAVARALHAGRRRLHVILRVEVGPCAVGRSARVDDRKLPRVPQRLQRLQPWIEPEKAVEIERRSVARAGPSDRDARASPVVLALAERHDDAEAVDGAALEDGNQLFRAAALAGRERGPSEKRRREPERHEGAGAVFQEYASRSHSHYRSPEGSRSFVRRSAKASRSFVRRSAKASRSYLL